MKVGQKCPLRRLPRLATALHSPELPNFVTRTHNSGAITDQESFWPKTPGLPYGRGQDAQTLAKPEPSFDQKPKKSKKLGTLKK